jgi:transcriptional regulator with XRE-family HTH domain
MMTGDQLRAARSLLNMDRSSLAELAGLSLPTIQRMESAEGVVGGNVESLMKVIDALKSAGVALIGDDEISQGGGRGVRLVKPESLSR